MKSTFLVMLATIFAAALAAQTQPQPQRPSQGQPQAQAPAQAQQQPQPPVVYGRGRGGLPWAWNDKDRDGICDLTGRPVGQGRPIGSRWGRGAWGGGWGWGRGRGGIEQDSVGMARRLRSAIEIGGESPLLRAWRPLDGAHSRISMVSSAS